MEKKRQGLHQRWERMYRRSSIQMILSLSFTAVAVIGMLFLGMALLFRFSSSANSMAADNTRRILTQVNLNLDRYLHNMMQVSDTVYYRVIKNADLSQQKGREELQDALELLYAKDRDVLVSLAIFEGDGSLVAATPLEDLKNSVSPHREDWFTSAMERFVDNDWGTMCGEDFEMNVNAMLTGGRIMGVYKTKLGKIWIINDDALATEQTITVLYPSEY